MPCKVRACEELCGAGECQGVYPWVEVDATTAVYAELCQLRIFRKSMTDLVRGARKVCCAFGYSFSLEIDGDTTVDCTRLLGTVIPLGPGNYEFLHIEPVFSHAAKCFITLLVIPAFSKNSRNQARHGPSSTTVLCFRVQTWSKPSVSCSNLKKTSLSVRLCAFVLQFLPFRVY